MTAPRFTIARLMIVVAVCSVLMALVPVVGASWGWLLLASIPALSIGVGIGGWWVCHWHPVWASLGLMVSSAVPIGLVLLGDLDSPYLTHRPVVEAILAILTAPLIVGFTIALAGAIGSIRGPGRRTLAIAALLLCPLVAELAILTHWPWHMMFRLARPTLANLAEQAAAGQPIPFPVRAGIFLIKGVSIDPSHPGNVLLRTHAFVTNPNGFLRRVESPEDYAQHPLGSGMTLDTPLDGTWSFQEMDFP